MAKDLLEASNVSLRLLLSGASHTSWYVIYGKCQILYTKVSDKMAYTNSSDSDQAAPEGHLIRVYTVCHSTRYFKKQLYKKQTLGQKSILNKVLEILGH